MRRPVCAAAQAVAALALAACQDRSPLTAPLPATPASNAVASDSLTDDGHYAEAHFIALSARHPEFAGYYIDGAGNLVVNTTGSARDSELVAELTTYARTLPVSAHEQISERKVVLRRVQHSYAKLAKVREKLERDLSDPEVAFFDLDEVANRVAIGIEKSPGRTKHAKVAVSVRRLAVPEEAVDLVEVARAVPAVGVRTAAEHRAMSLSGAFDGTINGYQRPLAGGLQIDWQYADGSVTYCTIGFVSNFDGFRRLTTNSHCSQGTYQTDATPYAQGSEVRYDLFDAYRIGYEIRDYAGSTCFVSGYGYMPCRESDANFAVPGNYDEAPVGYIARTTSYNGGGGWAGGYGSLVIDQATPTIRITDHERGLSVGTVLDKVGAKTGWTYGRVTRTCVGTPGTDGYFRKCTHFTDLFSLGGDSGSPMFLWQGATAILYGVLWGGDRSSNTIYSGFRSVEYDYGVRDQERIRVAAY